MDSCQEFLRIHVEQRLELIINSTFEENGIFMLSVVFYSVNFYRSK